MKKANKRNWALIREIMFTSAVQASVFLLLLFQTRLGNIFPDAMKVYAAIGTWAVTVAFLIAHITPQGTIEYKIWPRKN